MMNPNDEEIEYTVVTEAGDFGDLGIVEEIESTVKPKRYMEDEDK